MGGYGSGRWRVHTKADTVEDCYCLDAARWQSEGILRPNVHVTGGWKWTNHVGEKVSSIGYELVTDDTTGWVRLYYTFTRTGERMDYRQGLTSVPRHFGGRQWYFVCRLSRNGRYCGGRVRKLSLPPGGRYYGCRHCHDLTYTSCQESHRWDGLYRELARGLDCSPAEVRLIMSDTYRR